MGRQGRRGQGSLLRRGGAWEEGVESEMGRTRSAFVGVSGGNVARPDGTCGCCQRRQQVKMAVSTTREDGRKRVVITGLGVVSAFGTNVDDFYDQLLSGKSAVSPVEGFEVDDWPTRFAAEIKRDDLDLKSYVQPKMVSRLDPFLLYTLVVGKKALEDAGLAIGSDAFGALEKTRCGVILGSGMGGIQVFRDGIDKMLSKKKLSPFTIPFTITNMGSGMFAIDTGFSGPNYSLSTACATGNYAINNAAAHIQRGEADVMVAGGAEAAVNPVRAETPAQ